MRTSSRHAGGFSLVESMIAILMVSVVFLAIIGVYEYFGKGIIKSKVRTIATNLAQERLESIKNTSYYRVVVSTCTHNDASDGNGAADLYSPSLGWPNVPDINLNIGGYVFNRYFVVEKASEAVGGAIAVLPPGSADTGLKVLTVFVRRVNADGSESEMTRFSSLMGDPTRTPLGGTLTGLVRRADTLAVLDGVDVFDTGNLNWTTSTGVDGKYSLEVSTTSLARIFRAQKKGYLTAQSPPFTFASGQTQNWSPDLDVMSKGTLTGSVVFVDTGTRPEFTQTLTGLNGADVPWLRISEVAPGTAPEEGEFVELYNPTPYPIAINAGNFKLRYHPEDTAVPVNLPLTWVNNTVQAYGYFLIAGTPTAGLLNGVAPDAYYAATNPGVDSMRGYAGGIIPKNQGVDIARADDVVIDAVAWRNNNLADPVSWGEGISTSACVTAPPGVGLGGILPGSPPSLERKAWWNADTTSMAAGGVHASSGNAFDSNDNASDWTARFSSGPQNSFSPPEMIWIGSATISCSDGLSATTMSWNSPAWPVGKFSMPDIATMVATGRVDPQLSPSSWVVQASSYVLYDKRGTVEYRRALYGLTTQPWSVAAGGTTSWFVYMTSTPVDAGITGTVYNSNGGTRIPAANIQVKAGGATTLTKSDGTFLLTQVSAAGGAVTLDVNAGNLYQGLTYDQRSGVNASSGVVTNIDDPPEAGPVYLHPAGVVSGKVTSNGTDAIPYMTVRASATGPSASWPAQDGITDSNGNYAIKNLATSTYWPGPVVVQNPYSVFPVLDQNDTSTPPTRTLTVPTGSNLGGQDFTIARGWGKISGLASDVAPIKTGVLIIATTATIADPANPPAIDSAFRVGANIYYGTSVLSDGTYEVQVRYKSTLPQYTYNVYAWYVKPGAGDTVVTYRSNKPITLDSLNKTVNFISTDWVTP